MFADGVAESRGLSRNASAIGNVVPARSMRLFVEAMVPSRRNSVEPRPSRGWFTYPDSRGTGGLLACLPRVPWPVRLWDDREKWILYKFVSFFRNIPISSTSTSTILLIYCFIFYLLNKIYINSNEHRLVHK